MTYLILIVALLFVAIVALGLWADRTNLRKDVEFLKQENNDLRQETSDSRRETSDLRREMLDKGLAAVERELILMEERDNAIANLAVVLKADPIPFNKVAVELGLHGVVYRFHSLEDPKEITA